MDQLLILIAGGLYILFMWFFVLLVVRLYQALTIYVAKNAHYLPPSRFMRVRSNPRYDTTDDMEIDSEDKF